MDGLPRNTRYRSAVLNDPDMARIILDQEEEARRRGDIEQKFEWDPSEYSPEVIAVQRLEGLIDELAVILTAQLQGKKSKRKQQGLPKLRTAVEAERDRRRAKQGSSIIERFTPWAA